MSHKRHKRIFPFLQWLQRIYRLGGDSQRIKQIMLFLGAAMPFCRIQSINLTIFFILNLKHKVLIFEENDGDDVDIRPFRYFVTLKLP